MGNKLTRSHAVRDGSGSIGRRTRRTAAGALGAAVLAMVAAACGTPSPFPPTPNPYTAPSQGNGPNGSFYAIPPVPSGTLNGQLLYYVPATSGQINNANLWTVAYASTDAVGAPDVVTGTVVVPTAAWSGSGPRPIVSYAVGTQGLGSDCAPSKMLVSGLEYEDPNINAAVAAGYAVAVTDYQWGGTTNTPPLQYMVGLSAGHAVLDMARVAPQIPNSGLSLGAPVIVWGYSQGGNAAGMAGQLWKTYQPSVNLIGVAAGGVPGDLPAVGISLDGGAFAGFELATVVGFHAAYPDLPFTSLMNATGSAAVTQATQHGECVGNDVTDYAGKSLTNYTVGGTTITQALALGNWTPDLLANSPGNPGSSIAVPVYNFRGLIDEIIPTTVEDGVYANWCKDGTVVQAATYPGDHALTIFEGQSDVLTFISNRLAGKTPVNSCTTNPSSL